MKDFQYLIKKAHIEKKTKTLMWDYFLCFLYSLLIFYLNIDQQIATKSQSLVFFCFCLDVSFLINDDNKSWNI